MSEVAIHIDGSQGEGGGQVLRSSLTLAAVTGSPVRVHRVRAGRRKPGLRPQHLTAVRAAAEVCGAHVQGDELGSREIVFHPGETRPGSYRFAVGTAGSACLICQTVLPILLAAGGQSELLLEGGTHNALAPPYDFLERVFFPLLRRMGVGIDAELLSYGFYPVGGGSFRIRLTPPATLRPLELLAAGADPVVSAWVYSARIPGHVATRELAEISRAFELPAERCEDRQVSSAGPGNAVCILLDSATPELVTAFGEPRVSAEKVAHQAIVAARRFLEAAVPVGEHLADQLLVPISLAGGAFRTTRLSPHATTNVMVVRSFLGRDAITVRKDGAAVVVEHVR